MTRNVPRTPNYCHPELDFSPTTDLRFARAGIMPGRLRRMLTQLCAGCYSRKVLRVLFGLPVVSGCAALIHIL